MQQITKTHQFVATVGLLLAVALPVSGQPCETGWIPGHGVPGIDGGVNSIVRWDHDGSPDTPDALVVGGAFSSAGNAAASNIAAWIDGDWKALGSGLPDEVLALAVLLDGRLVAAGAFVNAGGNNDADRVAAWTGSEWANLGTGIAGGRVRALHVQSNGTLIAAGEFTTAGGSDANRIAMWSGSDWNPVGDPNLFSGKGIYAITSAPNGDLLVGGDFYGPATTVARWNGTHWSGTSGFPDSHDWGVYALATLSDGTIVAGGDFLHHAGASYPELLLTFLNEHGVWTPLLTGPRRLNGPVKSIVALGGDLVVGGSFTGTVGGQTLAGIGRLSGGVWNPVGAGFHTSGIVRCLAIAPSGQAVAGGGFRYSGSVSTHSIAILEGSNWLPLGPTQSLDGTVLDLVCIGGGVVATGSFRSAGDTPIGGSALWNGLEWTPFGEARSWTPQDADVDGDGRVIVAANGGAFRWSGDEWELLGGLSDGSVTAVKVLSDGRIAAGGEFSSIGGVAANSIAVWNGLAWTALADGTTGPSGSQIQAIEQLHDGSIVVGGIFASASSVPNTNRIARWDGSQWNALDQGIGGASWVYCLMVLPNGDLVAGGTFTAVGGQTMKRIAVWNGTSWAPLGAGLTEAAKDIAILPNGDLLVGGYFENAGGDPDADFLARWDGSEWSAFGPPVDSGVEAITVAASGEIVVGGGFTHAGLTASTSFARWNSGSSWQIVTAPDGDVIGCANGSAEFTVGVSAGYAGLSFQWSKDGIDLVDGPTATSSVIAGASSPNLLIQKLTGDDAGEYTCRVSDACVSRSTIPIQLQVEQCCAADYNGSGELDVLDFLDFLDDFGSCEGQPTSCGSLGNPDINGDTIIDVLDFLDFLDAFGQGC